ncbi:hypothetical protein QWY90_04625 [Flavobacterium paronense]|uniref:Lipoprotein n=1 Tax=Flavobacterium paronense TaxID=1392775 RepID=A0ABV5GFP1_9FLAO|nr:hypothetical protein [Flavobacterium paronense]MDN3676591.1 hypothetical protein [Flavobacterium paronense]
MKRIVIVGFLFLLSSCQNKEVVLPQANETVVADVKDHSPIYFFFKAEEKDTLIDVNRNNSISSTNWLFNIDKRLPLRKVILEIKKLQAKKEGSMHKSETSENYFTYTDTVKKTMAFLPFTKVKYKLEKPDFNVVFFYLDRNDLVHFRDEVFSKNELQPFLDKQLISASSIVFAYDKGMSFGKYIQYQFFVKHLIAPKGMAINSKKEYIY